MKTLIALTFLALGATPAFACGDGMPPKDSVATPQVKAALRAAYEQAHPGAAAVGPLPGHTYYSEHMQLGFAVATFDGRPRVFVKAPGAHWKLVRDTWGTVCGWDVPTDVLAGAWWFPHSHGSCYRVPA
jgi:hypothetical protein